MAESKGSRQSLQKPNMTENLCRKRKLADSFIPYGNYTLKCVLNFTIVSEYKNKTYIGRMVHSANPDQSSLIIVSISCIDRYAWEIFRVIANYYTISKNLLDLKDNLNGVQKI